MTFDNLQSRKARRKEMASEADINLLAAGLNQFAFDRHADLSGKGPKNRFFSPYSIALALAMAYAGAEDDTAKEMAAVFHYPPALNDLHQTMFSLERAVSPPPDWQPDMGDAFELKIANALWGQKGYPFLESYLDTIAAAYGAGIKLLDFKYYDTAREIINYWVTEQTEERINDLLPPGSLSPFTRLVITNAIYFHAGWVKEFSKYRTEMGDFYPLSGETGSVEMMTQTDSFDFYSDEDLQMVVLPYAGYQTSMILVMPKQKDYFTWLKHFDLGALDSLLAGQRYGDVILTMPKFKIEDDFSVRDSLRSLGMKDAFNVYQADFSQMVDADVEPIFISDVVHKAYVSVDEEGTEAAAATAIMAVGAAFEEEEPQPVPLVFDKPFFFLIRDESSGAILFMGDCLKP